MRIVVSGEVIPCTAKCIVCMYVFGLFFLVLSMALSSVFEILVLFFDCVGQFYVIEKLLVSNGVQ